MVKKLSVLNSTTGLIFLYLQGVCRQSKKGNLQ